MNGVLAMKKNTKAEVGTLKNLETSEKKRYKREFIAPEVLAAVLEGLKIQKNIPLPLKARKGLSSLYTPFLDKFKEGDCVFLDDEKIAMRTFSAAEFYGKKNGKTFAKRTEIKPNGTKRIGIWRIK